MITMSYRIAGGDFEAAGLATRRLKEQLARIGVGAAVMRRVMIASYEAEMNVVIHARTGTLWARVDGGKLDLEVADEGPGIPDIELALQEGWSTASAKAREMGFGAGLGLPNIRRNSDLFEVETRVGKGTRIRSTILLAQSEGAVVSTTAAEAGSVSIATARCRGCLRCIFACPTAALRVHSAGPVLLPELCIGCAECISECAAGVYGISEKGPASAEELAVPTDAVLVVSRGFLSGFPVADAPSRVLAALRALGYAEIRLLEEWSAALLAESRSRARTAGVPLPLIPPVCPAVVALVESRYPSLIPNLGPWLSPAEAAGEEFPLRPVVLAAACPAQYSAVGTASLTDRLTVISPVRLAEAVRARLPAASAPESAPTAPRGEPAQMPGELIGSGVRHVMRILSAAEAGGLPGVTLLDLSLCDGGCAGSPLLSAEPCLSRQRWRQSAESWREEARSDAAAIHRARPYAQRGGVRLDPDMGTAVRALSRIDALTRTLPGRDCGACGAPACALFAEDVVMGRADPAACPHAAPHGPTTEARQ